MEPSEIRELTIKCLHKAVLEMMSFEWHQEVAKRSEAERKEASLLAMSLFNEKSRLESTKLEKIRDKLQENKDALKSGTTKLKEALQNLNKVKNVLNAVNSLLSVVTKVAVR